MPAYAFPTLQILYLRCNVSIDCICQTDRFWECDLYSRATYGPENFVHVENMHPFLGPAVLRQSCAYYVYAMKLSTVKGYVT